VDYVPPGLGTDQPGSVALEKRAKGHLWSPSTLTE
jgi:hypothetical protein